MINRERRIYGLFYDSDSRTVARRLILCKIWQFQTPRLLNTIVPRGGSSKVFEFKLESPSYDWHRILGGEECGAFFRVNDQKYFGP